MDLELPTTRKSLKKDILSTSLVLKYNDVNKPIKLSAEVSSTTLGAVVS